MPKATSIGGLPPIKQLNIQVKGGKAAPNFDAIVGILRRNFTRLRCPGCLSGLNRLVIEDIVARSIR